MYIEFKVDDDNHSFLGHHLFKMLEIEVATWAQTNKITYTKKFYKNTFRVAFNDNKHYTVFRLTWKDLHYVNYQLIDNKW